MTENQNDITKEIDELIGSLAPEPSPEPIPTPTPGEEPPTGESIPPSGEPTPKLDVKEGELSPKPEGEPVSTPPPEPVKVEPTVEGEETIEEIKERNKLLLARIEELTPVPGVTATPLPKPIEDKGEPSPIPLVPTKVEEVDFLAGQSVDDLIDDPKKLNTLLNSIYLKARDDAKEDAAKAVLTALPGVVSSEVTATTNTNAVVSEFYQNNEDLVVVKKTVMAVAAQVHADKPEFGYKEVLNEAASRTRKLLGLRTPVPKTNTKFDDPAFAGGGTPRKPAHSGPKTLQHEIDELITH